MCLKRLSFPCTIFSLHNSWNNFKEQKRKEESFSRRSEKKLISFQRWTLLTQRDDSVRLNGLHLRSNSSRSRFDSHWGMSTEKMKKFLGDYFCEIAGDGRGISSRGWFFVCFLICWYLMRMKKKFGFYWKQTVWNFCIQLLGFFFVFNFCIQFIYFFFFFCIQFVGFSYLDPFRQPLI